MPPPREADLPDANRNSVDRDQPQRIFAFAIPASRAMVPAFFGVGGQVRRLFAAS